MIATLFSKISAFIFIASAAVSINIQDIPSSDLNNLEGQTVNTRGFVYQVEETGDWVVSSRLPLRSCCRPEPSVLARERIVLSEAPSKIADQAAVIEVQGEFHQVAGRDDVLYRLDNVVILESARPVSGWEIYLLLGGFVFVLFAGLRLRR